MPMFETRDGARLHYRVQGRDTGLPPLILIHGWCSNMDHWEHQVKHFSRRHRILRLDRRGHGRSTTPGDGHTAKQHAADVAAVAKAAEFRGAIAIGHAGGGPGTLEFTRAYPRLVKAAVIVDSGMHPLPDLEGSGAGFGAVLRSMIDALSGPKGRSAFRQMYNGFFHPAGDRVLARQAVQDAARTPLSVAIDELRGMAVNTEAIADGIRQPVLWLTAARADQAYIAAHLRKVQFAQVVGAGHFPQLEVPAQTNAMIETFIERFVVR